MKTHQKHNLRFRASFHNHPVNKMFGENLQLCLFCWRLLINSDRGLAYLITARLQRSVAASPCLGIRERLNLKMIWVLLFSQCSGDEPSESLFHNHCHNHSPEPALLTVTEYEIWMVAVWVINGLFVLITERARAAGHTAPSCQLSWLKANLQLLSD